MVTVQSPTWNAHSPTAEHAPQLGIGMSRRETLRLGYVTSAEVRAAALGRSMTRNRSESSRRNSLDTLRTG